jgi:hypothetical protein
VAGEDVGSDGGNVVADGLPTVRLVARNLSIIWTPMWALRWSRTSWAASLMACTANAVLANMPAALRC